jgi:hypothetical protein
MTDSIPERDLPTGITPVPHYVGEALSTLCESARECEREAIAQFLEVHGEFHRADDIRAGAHHHD